MKVIHGLIFLMLFSAIFATSFGQAVSDRSADEILNKYGEIYFKFTIQDKNEINLLTKVISIDKYKGNEVFAYANREEFKGFLKYNLPYSLLPLPGTLLSDEELNMGNATKDNNNRTIWNFYPNYSQFLSYMAGFASAHPAICKVDTIGTTIQGRLLLALKISDSVNTDRSAPQIFYSSSIHGDELTGYVLMLHLIDSLVSGYNVNPRITNLVNNCQIYITPLANPDGTFHNGDNSVAGAVRYNANNVDLNRNYPDPVDGQHPDGQLWQQETSAFMNYQSNKTHFSLSANFHGGYEVFNYPWDTWAKLHADDSWWQFVGREYADTVHVYSVAGYMDDESNGITNGYAWYRITGGRQDYTTYFKHGREVTIEISTTKTPAASQLLNYWKYNCHSFLNYMEEVLYGINGKITDSITGAPLRAKVFIAGHDIDSAFVYSNLPSGWYYRPIYPGTYSVTYSAGGYNSKTVSNVNVSSRNTTRVNVRLTRSTSPVSLTATASGPGQITLLWVKNYLDSPVIIAYNTTSTFGTPVAGTVYNQGSVIPGGGTVIYNGAGTTYNHTGLNPNTTCYYQAWSVLPGTSYSTFVAAYAVTSCGTVLSFPYSEGFENNGLIPGCWTQEQVSSSGINWTFIPGSGNSHPVAAHGGTYNACLKDVTTADNKTRLISPPMNLSAIASPQLKFWHTQAVWSGRQDQLAIYYRTSATGTWTLITTYTTSITAWTQETVNLPNSSSTYYIAFEGNAKYGYGVCIDDVSVTGTAISKSLNLTVFLEGLYASATNTLNQAQECTDGSATFNKFSGTTADTLSVLLAAASSPWAYLYQAHGVSVSTSGTVSLTIPPAFSSNYYIVIKHRQSVETWSSTAISFAGSTISYNFTTAASQAFGNNEVKISESSVYGMYAGDITSIDLIQDGYVDIFDNNDIFNKAQNGSFGYMTDDITGDGFVDLFDMVIVFNNMQYNIGLITPPNPLKKSFFSPGVSKIK